MAEWRSEWLGERASVCREGVDMADSWGDGEEDWWGWSCWGCEGWMVRGCGGGFWRICVREMIVWRAWETVGMARRVTRPGGVLIKWMEGGEGRYRGRAKGSGLVWRRTWKPWLSLP